MPEAEASKLVRVYSTFGGVGIEEPHENLPASLALMPVHVRDWVEAMVQTGQLSPDTEFTLAAATLGRFLKLVPLIDDGGTKRLDREKLKKVLNPEILGKLLLKQPLSPQESFGNGDGLEKNVRTVAVKAELRRALFEAVQEVFFLQPPASLEQMPKPGVPRFTGNTTVHALLNDKAQMGDMLEAMFEFIDGVLANLGTNIFHGSPTKDAPLRVHLHKTLSARRRTEFIDLTSDKFIQELLYPLAQAFFAYWVIARGNRYLAPLAQHDVPEKKGGGSVMQILREVTAEITRRLRSESDIADKIYNPDGKEELDKGQNPHGWSFAPAIVGRGVTPDGDSLLGDAYAGSNKREVERDGHQVRVARLPLVYGAFGDYLTADHVEAVLRGSDSNIGDGHRKIIRHELNRIVNAIYGLRIEDPAVSSALLGGSLRSRRSGEVRTWVERGHQDNKSLLPAGDLTGAATTYAGIAREIRRRLGDKIEVKFKMRPTAFIES